MADQTVDASPVVKMTLCDGGWAVQRLISRGVEQQLDDGDVPAADDALRNGGNAVLEVATQAHEPRRTTS